MIVEVSMSLHFPQSNSYIERIVLYADEFHSIESVEEAFSSPQIRETTRAAFSKKTGVPDDKLPEIYFEFEFIDGDHGIRPWPDSLLIKNTTGYSLQLRVLWSVVDIPYPATFEFYYSEDIEGDMLQIGRFIVHFDSFGQFWNLMHDTPKLFIRPSKKSLSFQESDTRFRFVSEVLPEKHTT